MKKGMEDFESYLAGFSVVELPAGAKDRILLPALAVADNVTRVRETSWSERLGAYFEALFAVPIRVFALSSVLIAANFAMDGQTPKLSAEMAAGREPVVELVKPLSNSGRGWFIDAKALRKELGNKDFSQKRWQRGVKR